MITLINGRGQLGNALNKIIQEENLSPSEDILIYHTWDILDKSEPVQKTCYTKFTDFVRKNKRPKIIFISTYSQTDNFYNYYKQLSEIYLLSHSKTSCVVRLPTIIGKGICESFKTNNAKPFGEMELLSIEDAARQILDFSLLLNYKVRNFRVYGKKVDAGLVKKLIEYGRGDYESSNSL
jgi:hypothetical protein